MRVYNNTDHILHVGNISLPPGVSEVVEKDWEKVAKHPVVQSWSDLEQVEIESGDLADITDIKPASKALKVIESTFDVEKLKAWAKAEDRPAVLAAIKEQIKYLGEKSDKTVKSLLTGEQGGSQGGSEDNA